MPFTRPRAEAVVEELDLDLECGVCLACLCIVAFALDSADERNVQREVRRITKDLWYEGLEEHALATVRRAIDRGVVDAESALADLEQKQSGSVTARAIVRKLGLELLARIHTESRLRERARERLGLAPPELN